MTEGRTLHASAVGLDGLAVLITGHSGCGKSSLALEAMALGAKLIADDRVDIYAEDGAMQARAPFHAQGLIEARGVGVLELPPARCMAKGRIIAELDLESASAARMPEAMFRDYLGYPVPLIAAKGLPGAPAVIMALLQGAKVTDPDQLVAAK